MVNKYVCLTCGNTIDLLMDHPANLRVHDGIAYRGSCENCYVPKKKVK